MTNLYEQLTFEEGKRLKKYKCTEGFNTIGIGHNMDASPMFEGKLIPDAIDEYYCQRLFKYDVDKACHDIDNNWKGYETIDSIRLAACINMVFQLGINGFMQFKGMLTALYNKDWVAAHDAALNSKWDKQTPNRAKRVASQLLTGKWYDCK